MWTAVWGRKTDAQRIADEAGLSYNPAADISLTFYYKEQLRGGVIYRDFTGRSCQIHIASFHPRWFTPQLLWETMHYPFEVRGCEVMFGYIPSFNKASLKFALNIGFRLVSVIEDVFNDGDLLVLALYKEECRFLAPPAWR